MLDLTLVQMIKTSLVMPILLIISVLVVAQALERVWAIWFLYRLPSGTWNQIQKQLQRGNRMGALEACKASDNVITEALGRMLNLGNPTTEQLVETFQLYRQRLHMALTRRLGFFGTISFISPLIGLTGTVLGIMHAFHSLAEAGAGGPAVVAAGISEALITTAAGIGLAVVSAVCYNYFTLTVRHRMNLVDLWVLELAELLSRTPAQPAVQMPPQPMSQFPQQRMPMPHQP